MVSYFSSKSNILLPLGCGELLTTVSEDENERREVDSPAGVKGQSANRKRTARLHPVGMTEMMKNSTSHTPPHRCHLTTDLQVTAQRVIDDTGHVTEQSQ